MKGEMETEEEQTGLTQREELAYRTSFNIIDVNNDDGSLSKGELLKVWNVMGFNPTEEDVNKMMSDADMDEGKVKMTSKKPLNRKESTTSMSSSSSNKIVATKGAVIEEIAIPDGLTKDQVEEIRQSFEAIDINKDGRLSKSELTKAAYLLGMNPTDKDIERMMKSADADNDGFISFKEYLKMMKENYVEINMESERMKAAFSILDKDKDGYVSLREFKAAICYNNDSVTEKEIEEFFHEVDEDGDGKINFEDFIESSLCSKIF